MGSGDSVEIYRAGTLPEARALRCALEGEGISVLLDN